MRRADAVLVATPGIVLTGLFAERVADAVATTHATAPDALANAPCSCSRSSARTRSSATRSSPPTPWIRERDAVGSRT